jgi:uncharacterized protein (TIGR01777 family)
MRVAVTGATGFVGRNLMRHLLEAGHVPVALTRDEEAKLPDGGEVVVLDPYEPAEVAKAIRGCQGIVNLQGANLFAHRWSAEFQAEILASRVETTLALAEAIRTLDERPEVLVNASAVGIYGPRDGDEVVDEDTIDADRFAPADFLADVCRKWEAQAREAERSGVRVVRLRSGVVLGPGGGALKQMELPFKLFVGGRVGSGKQVLSWIHLDDLARLILFALENRALSGAVNAVAPAPVTSREFARAMGEALGRPSFFPTPAFALRLALGKVATVVTTGQRVAPKRALAAGFVFHHPTIGAALASIYAAKTAARARAACR